jgi:hypothetical protein
MVVSKTLVGAFLQLFFFCERDKKGSVVSAFSAYSGETPLTSRPGYWFSLLIFFIYVSKFSSVAQSKCLTLNSLWLVIYISYPPRVNQHIFSYLILHK